MQKIYFLKLFILGVLCLFCFSGHLMAEQSSAIATNSVAKTIFDFQQEIGLSDQQMDGIKKIIEELQQTFAKKAEELKAKRAVLTEMIKDKKDLKTIRKQFEQIATIQVDSSMKDVEASRKIEKLMNPQQWETWKNIQIQMTQESLERRRVQQEQEK